MPPEFIMMPEAGRMAEKTKKVEKTLGLCRVRSLVAMEISKIITSID